MRMGPHPHALLYSRLRLRLAAGYLRQPAFISLSRGAPPPTATRRSLRSRLVIGDSLLSFPKPRGPTPAATRRSLRSRLVIGDSLLSLRLRGQTDDPRLPCRLRPSTADCRLPTDDCPVDCDRRLPTVDYRLLSTHAFAIATASCRTRRMYAVRSVTPMPPLASSRLNMCEHFRQ